MALTRTRSTRLSHRGEPALPARSQRTGGWAERYYTDQVPLAAALHVSNRPERCALAQRARLAEFLQAGPSGERSDSRYGPCC